MSASSAGQSPDTPDPADVAAIFGTAAQGAEEASFLSCAESLRELAAVAERRPEFAAAVRSVLATPRADPRAPWDVSRVCDDTTGPDGVGGPCVLPVGHPHLDGIGSQWTAIPPRLDPDGLARALHDADCGCGDYGEVEDPRYLQAVRAALSSPGEDTAAAGLVAEREQRFEHLATLDPNWDSYDAQPPSAQALVKAREIAVMLAGEPLICPTTDGGVQLAWPPDGERFEIVVAESGAVGITVDDIEFAPVSAALAARTPQPSEALHEWSCPSCGAVTRARMADGPPTGVPS